MNRDLFLDNLEANGSNDTHDAGMLKTIEATMIKAQRDMVKHRNPHEMHLAMPMKFCLARMKEFSDTLPTVGLLPTWERNIKRLVPKKLRKKNQESFQTHMESTREFYLSEMYNLRRKCVIKTEYESPNIQECPFKFYGRTVHRPRFIKNLNFLAGRYFLSHKLIQNIFFQAQLQLPEIIWDFRQYQNFEFIEYSTLFDKIDADVKTMTSTVINNYYAHIVTLLTTKRYVKDVPSNLLPSFLQCTSKILAYQLIRSLIRGIEHMLEHMENDLSRPTLKFVLRCENNHLYVLPLKIDFFDNCHIVLDKLASAGLFLKSFESIIDPSVEKIIPAIVPEWFMLMSHERLDKILNSWWEPLELYVASLQTKFVTVYNSQTPRDITDFIMGDHSFEECLNKVEDFNEYIREINCLTENEYLAIGKVEQKDAKRQLKLYANTIRNHIIQELLKRHRRFNRKICSAFAEVKRNLCNMPDTTKELIEKGEYIIWAKTAFLEDMRDKINLSIFKMVSFIDLVILDPDDIEFNRDTVNWISWIKPVLKKSSASYEQIKFDLEEQLQQKISNLNSQVEEMFSSLIVMDDMDDIKRIPEYIEDMRKLIRRLDRIEEAEKTINDEEELFHFSPTVHPRMKELKELILPYYELIYKALKWKRDSEVWLDGPFEYLDANTIENRTTEYYTDFSKISKAYKTRIKMQIATGCDHVFAGNSDDLDPFKQPAPLKLCYQLLENIKWLKTYVPLASVFCNSSL